jgi:hypothetical protein
MKQCINDNLTEIIRSQVSVITKQCLELGFCNKLKYNVRYKIDINNQTKLCILLNFIRL